jgi:hypothetical protein
MEEYFMQRFLFLNVFGKESKISNHRTQNHGLSKLRVEENGLKDKIKAPL